MNLLKAVLVAGVTLIGPFHAAAQPAIGIALVGGTIYVDPTTTAPIRDGVVFIQDGKIAAVGSKASTRIPPGTPIIDCAGLTITAGFWNSHVHFTERKWANATKIPAAELTEQLETMLTRFGFTSVFDTGSMWENTRQIRDRIESGEIVGPRIRSTGELLVPKGGVPPDLVLDVTGSMRVRVPEIVNADDALAASKKLLDAGVDGIKVYAQTWAPPIVVVPQDAIRAAVSEAHARQKLVFAHPSNRDGLLNAVRAGADILVHTSPQSGPWDESLLAEMKKAGVTLIPTLKLWKYELRHDRTSARERFAGVAIGQLRAWIVLGGMVLFGTDVGYMNDYDPTEEYILMTDAGMTFRQILASLTTTPAQRFGVANRGRIASGFAADLTVLASDPSDDARAFGSVVYTIRDGKVIFRAQR